jgi:hypothetical protein
MKASHFYVVRNLLTVWRCDTQRSSTSTRKQQKTKEASWATRTGRRRFPDYCGQTMRQMLWRSIYAFLPLIMTETAKEKLGRAMPKGKRKGKFPLTF